MGIDVTCTCGKRYAVPDDKAGMKLRCQECQSILQVPASTSGAFVPPLGKQHTPHGGIETPPAHASYVAAGSAPDMVYCRGCGRQLHTSAVACPACGARQGSASDAIPPWVLIAGYISAFIMPLIGIGFGIYALTKKWHGHGAGMIGASIACWIFWTLVLMAG